MKGPWIETFVEALVSARTDQQEDFAAVVDLLKVRKLMNGQLHFIGNGGSAAIASHMAIDFLNKADFATRCYNDAAALTCLSNDYGYKDVFFRQLKFAPSDVLFAISSSGESENIVCCAKEAALLGKVVTLSGFRFDNQLRQCGAYNFWVPSSNYGIVETVHLGLLHALLEAVQ